MFYTGLNNSKLPVQTILFACTNNAIRSPMAEAIFKYLFPKMAYCESVGVVEGDMNPFVQLVLTEEEIPYIPHKIKTFETLREQNFDLIIALSESALNMANFMTRTISCEIDFWNIPIAYDDTEAQNRDVRMMEIRLLRDALQSKILSTFTRE
jgi:protein-tyrosine-phosphatase